MIPNVDLPKGFSATGINAGVRRYRPDLGILMSDSPCVAVGTFTKNTFKASPVLYNMSLMPSDGIRAIVCNSGHANAATGEQGRIDNLEFATETAKALGIKQEEVLVASTGVVGERLPLMKLIPALPMAVRGFSHQMNNFALAIMTTDLVPKFGTEVVKLSGGEVRITACTKGSGMIHPNMATMLGFLATDLDIAKDDFLKILQDSVKDTFNMISVDGETSTNDMVLALANGESKVSLKTEEDRKIFFAAFEGLLRSLSIAIAKDGEGASKLITVEVHKAPSDELARECARMITISPLIKSAVHGEDPNWGRILVRLGQTGVPEELFNKLEIWMQDFPVFQQGSPQPIDRKLAKEKLGSDEVLIKVILGDGNFSATAWGCDLTKRYVEINTEYS
ncbi:bifunctional glutamate N-acetyltransferase/amino-acid acetyltransferase ArgJ [bacterium]|nr:bifunctional glutamate N-acetyltransferase/amino-acid acetyltransferase ArgJ [bacterium]